MTSEKRRGRPPASESPASVDAILAASLRVFAERGFDGTSIAAVNRELGVSHNLIHQRFGSKEDLWFATVDWAFGLVERGLADINPAPDTDLLGATRSTIVRFLELHAEHPEILRLVTVEGAVPSARLTYLWEAHIGPSIMRVLSPLKVLVDAGVLTEANIRSLHFLVAHGATAPFSLVPLAEQMAPEDPRSTAAVREHAEFVADLVVAGLKARGADRSG
ncbi:MULTISPECIES: TetR/AcrR family transcriptional regulator [unclassified Mycobacterium]|uniref:TetR/AcrR family transcriptional regulator n=1 Tax=unclassified Mycobacterium TaxID=2642494 RepID=UPI0005614630|nr:MULTISPECIES: TetR/AcrR family transcriptional regulator [unclassified Mycobacterium]SDZ95803.1 DNA-binding transcriptional regulator, AcrR family [Mycobacterium sp. 283mftsu]